MTKQSPPSIPGRFSKSVILKWNSQLGLAAVPESAFPKEARYVLAALKTMTNKNNPDWDAASAKICAGIENYAEIRSHSDIYEYVKDLTLSQFLMWELVRFLDENQPRIRLRKDKGRLLETPTTEKEKMKNWARRKEQGRKWFAELIKRCAGCRCEDRHSECPEEHGIETGLRKDGKYGCYVSSGG